MSALTSSFATCSGPGEPVAELVSEAGDNPRPGRPGKPPPEIVLLDGVHRRRFPHYFNAGSVTVGVRSHVTPMPGRPQT
jgi:hypothetical protein